MFGRTFSEGGSVQNEKGYYAGIESTAFRSLKLSLYGDIFSFPWLKYGVDAPSSGFDGMIKADYLPAKDINLNFSYRYREKEKNFGNEETHKKEVLFYRQHKWKSEIKYNGIKSMDFRTTFHWNRVAFPDRVIENGYSITQQIDYKPKESPFTFHIQGSWFYVPEYTNRISVYERGVLYGSSFSSLYGKGVKFHLYACYRIIRFMVLESTYSYFRYSDRDQTGTGLETIYGPVKKDIRLQCRIKF
ncbi:MAG: hypothetical protein LUE93_14980 [Bacteroides sp.]|nr:hypothetical protein [Bacteroides sp.]